MPVVDGFEAARRIRTSSRAARMPIVAVTANVMPGYRDVCIAAGMDDFVAKPALIGPLARVIDRWLPTSPTAERTSVKPPSVAHDAGLDRDVRRRLREIFHGDEARVEATLALALTSLRDGARTLGNSLEARDVEGAKQTAHKLKGVAVEVGFVSVSDHLRALERELRDGNWPAAAAAHARVLTEIDPATKTAAESLR
jgi:polar amino acid transport system substrate-binding protein